MLKKIRSFNEYLNEQSKKENSGGNDASLFANAMLAAAFDGLADNDFSATAMTDETKKNLPYSGCGSNAFEFIPSQGTNSQFMWMFIDKGEFANDNKYADLKNEILNKTKKIFLVGVREKLEIKKQAGDKFTDKIVIVDPSKPNDEVISYQITTCPSVAFYSSSNNKENDKGVAIIQPGVFKYKIGIHKKGTPSEHEALIQNGKIDIQRFPKNEKEITTYTPGNPQSGDDFGINIHRSSINRGICVGPYSLGCQVFSDGKDFDSFMKTMKESTNNNGEFLYTLIQKDDIK